MKFAMHMFNLLLILEFMPTVILFWVAMRYPAT